MSLSYSGIQFLSLFGIAFILFCSPLLSIYLLVVVIVLIFIDCDITAKTIELFGDKPEGSSLRNQVVWITGASSGIGEFLAYELSRCGCQLILTARNEAELNRVAETCKSFKCDKVLVLPLDITKTEKHDEAVAQVVADFGKIDILVNNAGRSIRGLFLETDSQVERQLFELDYFAQIDLSRKVIQSMVSTNTKNGQIVVVTSIAKSGVAFQSAYSAAKAALHGAFDGLRSELRSLGINIQFVVPGPVESKVSENSFTAKLGVVAGEGKVVDKRMSTERTTRLMSIALANRLPEIWIAERPYNFLLYAHQYFPSLSKLVLVPMMEKRVKAYQKVFNKDH